MNTTDTVPCDGCGAETFDPTPCEHDRELCPDCEAEGKCVKCREVYHALSNWRLG